MTNTVEKIFDYIRKYKMILPGDHVVAGVSGGADSVCLLLVLKELQRQMDFSLTAVHVNHCIRGEEAMDDEQFVEQLCDQIHVPCRTFHVQVEKMAKQQKLSVEEAGRKARYGLFRQVAEENGSAGNAGRKEQRVRIAVAHHMDDQSETVLMNLFRGSGVRGICGIQPVNDDIIRPLLCIRRAEIEELLTSYGQSFQTDSTNLENEYLRNRLRNVVIPYLSENINSSVVENVCSMADMVREAEEFLEKQAAAAFAKCVTFKEEDKTHVGLYIIDIVEFGELDTIIKKYVVREVLYRIAGRLKDVYKVHIESVISLLQRQSGARVDVAYGISAYREYDKILVKKRQDPVQKDMTGKGIQPVLLPVQKENEWYKFQLNGPFIAKDAPVVLKEVCIQEKILSNEEKNLINSKKIDVNDYTKSFDYDKIKFTLQVRTRQSGDYIVVDEKGSKKKLKDYFINEKVPRSYRDQVLLVADGSHIIWIVGYRMSAQYKLTKETKRMVTIAFTGNGTVSDSTRMEEI